MGNKIVRFPALITLTALILLWLLIPAVPLIAMPESPDSDTSCGPGAIGSPQIALSVSSGYVGDLVKVSGSGFAPGQRITFSVDGSSIISYLSGWDGRTEVITDTNGAFGLNTGTFGFASCNVPNLPGGVHLISAQDESGHTAAANLTILPRLTISKLEGPSGTEVTAVGNGLKANADVTISLSGMTAALAVAKTDPVGAFTQKFAVPTVSNGSYKISLSDGTTTQDFSFVVEGNLPPTPILYSPKSGTEVKPPFSVLWSCLDDTNLTYELQVGNNSGFSEIVFDKTDINESSFIFTGELTASTELYFWRVKAVDGAGNNGKWSAYSSFSVSSPPQSILKPIVTGGLIVLALIFGGYFLRSRGKYLFGD